ncbi:MAG: SpoVG family protein [Oscillospiraceae bacterium]|nr:SpoVG family protein [Oscillospiraceae bacterium]
MKITDIKIRRTFADRSIKAIVSITIDNCLAVHDIRIIQGNDRLFAAMPSRKDNDVYRDIVHPITAAARQKLEDIILTAYTTHIDIMENGGEINGY